MDKSVFHGRAQALVEALHPYHGESSTRNTHEGYRQIHGLGNFPVMRGKKKSNLSNK